ASLANTSGYILMYSRAKREEKALFCCWATTKMHPVNVAPFLGRPTSGLARAARASRAKGEREAYFDLSDEVKSIGLQL
ncbi:hypothetical protein, partial [Mesorhizobium sp.]|uniref:hypothetical protein n=1 Tax=Mesorhizobium sp. TaxID=1871066 RepID=UPI0025F9EE00